MRVVGTSIGRRFAAWNVDGEDRNAGAITGMKMTVAERMYRLVMSARSAATRHWKKVTTLDHREGVVMLTPQEVKVLKLLRDAWNEFVELEPMVNIDLGDFAFHIHALQNIVGARVALRSDPKVWKSIED